MNTNTIKQHICLLDCSVWILSQILFTPHHLLPCAFVNDRSKPRVILDASSDRHVSTLSYLPEYKFNKYHLLSNQHVERAPSLFELSFPTLQSPHSHINVQWTKNGLLKVLIRTLFLVAIVAMELFSRKSEFMYLTTTVYYSRRRLKQSTERNQNQKA